MSEILTLWLIGDGKPGHENQSLGLAEAMGRQQACEIHRLSLAGAGGVFGRLKAARTQARELPRPDVIIAAGHATHLPLLVLGRRYRAMTVVLMKPSLPIRWFGLCLAPEHDFSDDAGRRKVLQTRGAINRIRPSGGDPNGRLVLVGGPSKVHGWNGAAMLGMLEDICRGDGWELTDSRRTPDGFLEEVRERLPGVKVRPHGETGPGWLPETLAQAGEVWVSEDSVSMIYEALSSGARVGLLPVPVVREGGRVQLGVARLIEDGYLTPYRDWLGTQQLKAAPGPLQEADRCAELVLRMVKVSLTPFSPS